MYNKNFVKIEIMDNDLFLFIASLLRRIEKMRPDSLEVLDVDRNNRAILFITNSYFGDNISRILMEHEHFFWHDQREGVVKIRRLLYKVDS